MPGNKRYYWLKLQHDFFQSKRIKKLRKLAGGDTYTIIYLKMQLKAILNDGILTYSGIEPTFAEELALDIDEEPENVLVAVNYLLNCGLLETVDGSDYLVPYAVENTGSETSGAARARAFRERQRALQNNATVTLAEQNRNGEEEIEKEKETDSEVEEENPLARVMSYFMENISKAVPSSVTTQSIKDFTEELGSDVVMHALEITAEAEAHDWRYAKKILERYRDAGLLTIDAVLEDEKKFRKKKEAPKQKRDHSITPASTSKKTLDDLDRLLQKIGG